MSFRRGRGGVPIGRFLAQQVTDEKVLQPALAVGTAGTVAPAGNHEEVEVLAEQFDKTWPQIGIERLDQIAEIGLVEIPGKIEQDGSIIGRNGIGHPLDKGRPHLTIAIAQARKRTSRLAAWRIIA